MNIIQKIQEQYIQEFNSNVPLDEFVLNLLVVAILAVLLRLYYIHYGTAVSNRTKFANNFLPLALGTLLIIMIVKSSIALSLGLVGALSIVRFRAAIKDPEELTFLFFAIGIGLAGGANQPVLAIIAFVFILLILYVHRYFTKGQQFKNQDRMFVNIHTDLTDLDSIVKIITAILPYVELKRLDTLDTGMDLSFVCKADSIAQIGRLKTELSNLSDKTSISIIDQPDLIL